MYLAFTCMPGESYCRQLRSLLLYLCYVFQALINSLVYPFFCIYLHQVNKLYLGYIFWALINSLLCWFCTSALGLILFQICDLRKGLYIYIHVFERFWSVCFLMKCEFDCLEVTVCGCWDVKIQLLTPTPLHICFCLSAVMFHHQYS